MTREDLSNDRRALHAYLSETAHSAWQHYSEENGVSVTGLLESLGLTLADEMEETDPEDLRRPWIKAARRIDADRRKRGGR